MTFWKKRHLLFGLVLLACFLPLSVSADRAHIEQALADELDAEGTSTFVAKMNAVADLSAAFPFADRKARREHVYRTPQEVAARTQTPVPAHAREQGPEHASFLTTNSIFVRGGNLDVAQDLSALPGMALLHLERILEIRVPVDAAGKGAAPEATTTWGILDTHAGEVWDPGVRGGGIKRAIVEPGVPWDHTAIVDQYACPGNPANPDPAAPGCGAPPDGEGTYEYDEIRVAYNVFAFGEESTQGICVPDYSLSCGGADSWNNGGTGSTNQIYEYACVGWNESGPEYAYIFVPDVSGLAEVALSGLSADLDVFVLHDGSGCNANNCMAYGDVSTTFDATAGETYYLVVDGFNGAAGDYTIEVTCAVEPDITVNPLSLGSTQKKDTVEALPLDIGNVGDANLDWGIVESATGCASSGDIPWASVSPDMGTTPPSATSVVDVTFDSTGLAPMTYHGDLCVNSNDPDSPLVQVPLELVVEADPDITVDPLFIGSTQEKDQVTLHPLDIGNVGDVSLDWGIVESATGCASSGDIPWASVSPGTGTTPPSATSVVDVTFDSTGLAPMTYHGHLCVNSNDPDSLLVPVTLELLVEADPDITVDPLFIGSTQEKDSLTVHPLDIGNVGDENLHWGIVESATGCASSGDIPWASVSPGMGTTPPSATSAVGVTFDSTGLAPMTYHGHLCVKSNDPDSPLVQVTLELVVEGDLAFVYLPAIMSSYP